MKTKPIYILIITFVIIAAISFFLIKPVLSSIFSSWQALSQAKENLKNIDEEKGVLETLKNNTQLQGAADIAQKYIPKDEESSQLVIDISSIAASNNIKIEQTTLEKSKEAPKVEETATASPTPKANATPQPTTSPTAQETVKSVDFSIKVSGSFGDFMKFLSALETGSRLIMLKTVSIQSKVEAGSPISFSAQLAGSAFYKKDITLESNLDNIKIAEETIDKFLNLKSYGQPINLPGESGFGRTNPFEGY